jgi:hypothetical protein
LIGAAALLLLGCEQKTEAPAGAPASPTSKAATTAPAAATTAAQAAADDDLPTESDFEEEAEKNITADNLDAEIDKLDKEIGQ